jgi:drug/metabolite transporter (DMT)-like permease
MKRLLILFGLLCLVGRGQSSNNTSNAQIYNNQQAVTASAAALASQALRTICVKAMHANTTTVYIGNASVTTGNGMELIADQSWCGNITNANLVYIIGTAGANVSWIGTN